MCQICPSKMVNHKGNTVCKSAQVNGQSPREHNVPNCMSMWLAAGAGCEGRAAGCANMPKNVASCRCRL